MSLDPLKKELKYAFAMDMAQAVKKLEASLRSDGPNFDSYLQVKGRFQRLQQGQMAGTVSAESFVLESNRIRQAFLELISLLADDDIQADSPPPASPLPDGGNDPSFALALDDFLRQYQEEGILLQQEFQKVYQGISTLLIDFGQIIQKMGQMITGIEISEGQESQQGGKMQLIFQKISRQLVAFNPRLSHSLNDMATVNQQRITHFQRLPLYLEQHSLGPEKAAVGETIQHQKEDIDALTKNTAHFIQQFGFLQQIGPLEFLFKMDDQLLAQYRIMTKGLGQMRDQAVQFKEQLGRCSMELELL
ncbi:MAG: hypothetical protein AAFV95_16715 [Bacteroidota bacterium]